jgi:hypothetical protein
MPSSPCMRLVVRIAGATWRHRPAAAVTDRTAPDGSPGSSGKCAGHPLSFSRFTGLSSMPRASDSFMESSQQFYDIPVRAG